MTTTDVSEALTRLRSGFVQGRGALVLAANSPPMVFWANAAATMLFGVETAEALTALLFPAEADAATVPEVDAAGEARSFRFARTRFRQGIRTKVVSVAQGRIELPSGRTILAVAVPDFATAPDHEAWAVSVLPAAEAVPAQSAEPDIEAEHATPGADRDAKPDEALRARLTAATSNRFLWQTDADDCVTLLKGGSPDLFGLGNDRLRNRSMPDVLGALGCDGDGLLKRAFATRATWSNLRLPWPVGDGTFAVNAVLGAIPVFAAGQAFKGYHGFAVADLSQILPAPAPAAPGPAAATEPEQAAHEPEQAVEASVPAPAAIEPEAPVPASSADAMASYSSKVVMLRPYQTVPTFAPPTAANGGQDPASPADHDGERPADLTPDERSALDEIARTLTGGSRQEDQPDPIAPSPDDVDDILDALPLAIAYRDATGETRANRALLDRAGLAATADLASRGGLAALFGHDPLAAGAGPDDGDLSLTNEAGRVLRFKGHREHRTISGRSLALLVLTPDDPTRETAARSETWIEQVGSPMALVEPAGRILRLNAAAEALFGGKRDEFSGHDIAALFGPDRREAVASLIQSVNGGADAHTVDPLVISSRRVDGSSLPIALSARPAGGGRVALTLIDRSEKVRHDADLAEARAELDRAHDAKMNLLAKLSHELRTPLNAILGFAEVILDERFGPLGNPRYRDYVMDIHGSGSHVVSLLTDLLDLSKAEAGRLDLNPTAVDVNKVVGDQVAQFQPQAHRERVIMRTSLLPRLPAALVDEEALRQMLANVLSNAVKFNEPGGQVIISTALNDAGAVAVRIRDTGVGMSDEEIETATQPFRQIATTRPQGGSGLGLPLTLALAEANGAVATIKSRKAEGTLVEILLRADPAQPLRMPA